MSILALQELRVEKTLQEEQGPIDEAIVKELMLITPETWDFVALDVSWESSGGIEQFPHRITGPAGSKEIPVPSEHLFQLTRELSLLFLRRGHRWKSVRYEVRVLPDDSWRYFATFSYS
ncbi:MAG: hypothetical protein FD180_2314 [Planctomycetota bacterium]|nr:MAG: hypothetical protein FD180_2314 [Planctomycetota bacterium]